TRRYRVETAASRAETRSYWEDLAGAPEGVVLLSNVNPLFSMPSEKAVAGAFENQRLFKVSFSAFMDETTEQADLVLPVQLPLEMWDAYESKTGLLSTLQPAMGRFTKVPHIADILLKAARSRNGGYRDYLSDALQRRYDFRSRRQWLQTLGNGGLFETQEASVAAPVASLSKDAMEQLREVARPSGEMVLLAYPTIRFFDGRGANRSWLCEVPDPLSMVAWQTPLFLHPETADAMGLRDEDDVEIQTSQGRRTAPLYTYEGMHPNVAVVPIGQGHQSYGRYAKNQGMNPLDLVPGGLGAVVFAAQDAKLEAAGGRTALASVSGSRIQHGRKIALSTTLEELRHPKPEAHGLTMDTFPLTLPLPEGYDPDRDIYPPHEHDTYRWSMIVDLDRCVGCGACAVACYAENNLGVVGERQVIKGREMAWMRIERYQDPERMERITFLPMMCQHCDNAPCESVCPVYAPHHSKEGLNNQIYNRCIGTRFCSQNCPYKVRRFNWFTWQWPGPLKMQLNPRVTVRSKGVMEKCSFCVQRIKAAHDVAKNENRKIRDGEVVPACVQTCPTGALVFGNLMDKASRVRKLADDRRAYQVMGYLNTKPAVIYLKKVKQEI
ncbi:MAG: 4Fe-4S dicluster domain-containing protein, partial [Desulfobacteraceae bacterium]|nr:4Fe-4S dicluster domain-containing protein [Desulfobacteraceae bacterium]